MKPHIYMPSDTKQYYTDRHLFFVREAKTRILSQFEDIEKEAYVHMASEQKRLTNLSANENADSNDVSEVAYELAQEHYMLLDDMKKQMLLAMLAAMYHQWDKDIRDFMEREYLYNLSAFVAGVTDKDVKETQKEIWGTEKAIVDILSKDFKFTCPVEIETLRLIVNRRYRKPI